MRTSYFPSTDSALVSWGRNFSDQINASPSLFGLSVEIAQQFEVIQAELEVAYRKVINPATRTQAHVSGKNYARESMKQAARRIVSIINGQANVTDAQRAVLGLTVAKLKSKIPVPDVKPTIVVSQVVGHLVKVRVSNFEATGRHRRPTGVSGANLFCFAGENPPDPKEWKFIGNSSSRDFEIRVDPAIPPGTKLWITACWYNPRGMNGPAADPVFTYIQFGGTEVAMGVMSKAA